MVRPSFIKGLKDEELTLWEIIYEGIWYCKPMIFLRKIGRFLKALPDYIKICLYGTLCSINFATADEGNNKVFS